MTINTNSHTASASITPAVPAVGQISWLLLPIWISLVSPSVLAHGGHGNEFGSQEGTKSTKVQIDGVTAQQIGVQTVAAKKQSLNVEISATGQIELLPSKKAEVTAPIKGKLVRLPVQPGARVKAGQILAVMSSPELNDLRTSSLEKRSTALASLQQARTDRNLARTELELAQERYQKDVELVKSGALARRQMLESQAKLAAAQAQLQRANSAVTAAQTQLRLSDASYQGRLGQLGSRGNAQGIVTVTAPIDGTIADREVTLGQSVADAGARLMTITDDRQVLATANIYQRDLERLKIGQQVSVKVPGMTDKVFSGQISRIGTAVDLQSRVVPVQATLDNSEGLLKAGTFAEIKLATDRVTTPVVVIPASAVVEADQEKLVYVKSGDGYQPTTVTLGQTVGDLVEVKTGLFAGDLVVNQRAPQLYAQSLKKQPASEGKETSAAKSEAASQNEILTYLLWGLIPVAGILGGGAWWLKKRSESTSADRYRGDNR